MMCISFHSHGRTDGIKEAVYLPGQWNIYPSGRRWFSPAIIRVEIGPEDTATLQPDLSLYMSVQDARSLMEALGAVLVEHGLAQISSPNEPDEAAS
ncbi:hypothetical protein [Nocardia tengchongensis]|uniref:hypothetical protein n=1 Tax=Nocardia tengchongensis TaxID=2055889 RepID=UPI00368E9799